jgi:hypothetical protein
MRLAAWTSSYSLQLRSTGSTTLCFALQLTLKPGSMLSARFVNWNRRSSVKFPSVVTCTISRSNQECCDSGASQARGCDAARV